MDDYSAATATLSEAVHKLTEPFTTVVKQRIPSINPITGDKQQKGWKQQTLNHLPLIKQLENAVAGDQGDTIGAGSTAGSTLVINLDAVTKLADLQKELADSWIRLIPHSQALTVDIPLRKSLHIWHGMFVNLLGHGAERRLTLEATRWSGWVLNIERMFTPERIVPYNDLCPGCGKRYVDTVKMYGLTVDSGTYIDRRNAVTIQLRDPFEKSTASCSNPACGMTWDGAEGLALLGQRKPTRRKETTSPTLSPADV